MTASDSGNGSTEIDSAIAEYMMLVDRGERVECEEFIAAHPRIAGELRSYFANAGLFQEVLGNGMAETLTHCLTKPTPQPYDPIRSLGDYELLGEIARGGMGVVYRAPQRSLNRTMAVKMILPGRLISPADVVRFRREAEAAAGLRHPKSVAILPYEVRD
jgi:serine/threonine-protein kinase